MEEWRRLYPGDVGYERAFYAQKTRKKAFIEAELNACRRSSMTTTGGMICGSPPRRTPRVVV
jgi:hypothetical protein